jgi:hypothetical protein
MAGLDDSRMNRTYGNFMDPRTGDPDKRVVRGTRSRVFRNRGAGGKGQGRDGPKIVSDPGPGVFESFGSESEKIPDGPFEAVRRRNEAGKGREGRGRGFLWQREDEDEQALPKKEGRADSRFGISGSPQAKKASSRRFQDPGLCEIGFRRFLGEEGAGNSVLPGDETESGE